MDKTSYCRSCKVPDIYHGEFNGTPGHVICGWENAKCPDETDVEAREKWDEAHKEGYISTLPVWVRNDHLQSLIAQNAALKSDISALVGVFKGFAGLLAGKGGIMSIIPVITRLINNKAAMEKLTHIVPIIDKYTETGINEKPHEKSEQ